MSERKIYSQVHIPGSPLLDYHLLEKYKIADLHLHTNKSDGTVSPEYMVDIALLTGLNAIAITDHDMVEPSDTAIQYAQRNNLPIEVIRGMEVSSKDGHVLALNLEGTIERSLPLAQTIKEIHQHKGLAIVVHPHLARMSSVSLKLINDVINSSDPELYIDGIEIFNASEVKMQKFDRMSLLFKRSTLAVRNFVEKNLHNPKMGALLGNTDGHTSRIGYGITAYSYMSVLDAIRNRDTVVMSKQTNLWEDLSESVKMNLSVITSHLIGRI